VKEQRSWELNGRACMEFLKIDPGEVEVWSEILEPLFENGSAD
jgi:hypothetical protein